MWHLYSVFLIYRYLCVLRVFTLHSNTMYAMYISLTHPVPLQARSKQTTFCFVFGSQIICKFFLSLGSVHRTSTLCLWTIYMLSMLFIALVHAPKLSKYSTCVNHFHPIIHKIFYFFLIWGVCTVNLYWRLVSTCLMHAPSHANHLQVPGTLY